jgi:hypothetical protein
LRIGDETGGILGEAGMNAAASERQRVEVIEIEARRKTESDPKRNG